MDKHKGGGRSRTHVCRRNAVPDQNSTAGSHNAGVPDHNTISCRSSAREVAVVMSKFNDTKRDMVKAIGFGGLLQLPLINKVNRSFSLWLLSRTNWLSSVIQLDDNTSMQIYDQDIARIIGTPVTTKNVKTAISSEEEKKIFLETKLSFLGDERSILSKAAMFVQADLPATLTKQYIDNFKIAFVIFIIGRFLAPSVDYYAVKWDFWGALAAADEISSYNWSGYVLSNIIDSARQVEFTSLRNEPVSYITGCPLLLQVFYLDNLELGALSLPHDILPRIRVFDSSVLGLMIEADTCHAAPSPCFGCNEIRQDDNLCYLFHKQKTIAKAIAETSEAVHHKQQTDSVRNPNTQKNKNDLCRRESTSKIASPSTPVRPDFSAYLRNKYPEHLDNYIIDALKYHNARCIQHANRSKDALIAAVVKENMDLADKCMVYYSKQSGTGTSAPPRINTNDRRRTYEDLLSGPESGNEAEGPGRRARQKKRNLGDVAEYRTNRGALVDTTAIADDVSVKENQLHVVGSAAANLSTVFAKEADGKNNIQSQGLMKVPQFSTTPSPSPPSFSIKVEGSGSGSCKTPAATTKLSPISPQQSIKSEGTAIPIGGFDLNSSLSDNENYQNDFQRKSVKVGRFAKSHWAMAVDHPDRDSTITHILFDWLCTTNSDELKSHWIIHQGPRVIKCNGIDIKREFAGTSGLGLDLFDIAVRRFKQLDGYISEAGIPLRWRHMFDSDFAAHCLSNCNPIHIASIKEQFIGSSIDYELHRCRMFIVPTYVKGAWSCYAWDLREQVVNIIDPTAGSIDEDYIILLHSSAIRVLEHCIKYSVLKLFSGWQLEKSDFTKKVVRISDHPCKRSESAFYTLYCMKNFDGGNKVITSDAIIQKFKEGMLYEIFGLKDNSGTMPSVYVQTIDD